MIHCIGDSHSAVFSGEETMQPCWPYPAANKLPYFKTYRIGPATAYNLHTKQYIIQPLVETLNLDNDDKLLFCFGEVDNRAHLIKQSRLQNKNIDEIVEECVYRYLNSIKYYKKYTDNILFWGPIASWSDEKPYTTGPTYGTNVERNLVTEKFNILLKQKSEENGFGFISVFHEMLNSDMTTKSYCLDDWEGCHIHLHQRFLPVILEEFKKNKLIN